MKEVKVFSMIMTISMIVCLFGSTVLGIDVATEVGNLNTNDTLSVKLNSPIKAVLGVITIIAAAVAVGMLIYIGIKYMTKGAGGKAEVKDTLLPYLIGAILVGGASALASAALGLYGG